MNEEEIINKIDEIIEYSKLSTDIGFADQTEKIEALQGILDLYNKEKEKNKELENADLTTVYMNGFYDGEKKWKDKIKERYEKLKHYDYIEIKELLKLLEGE